MPKPSGKLVPVAKPTHDLPGKTKLQPIETKPKLPPISGIADYIEDYKQRFNGFNASAVYVEDACRSALVSGGILADVSSRAKDPERLRNKLLAREKDGTTYSSLGDIENDIVDIIGVRIILYFPTQLAEVVAKMESLFWNAKHDTKTLTDNKVSAEQLLQDLATDDAVKELDLLPERVDIQRTGVKYVNKYGDYRAVHIRFVLQKHDLGTELKDILGMHSLKVEVQIQTLLLHSWSEVNHDLSYKTLSGSPSIQEYELLDCLNGIGKLGEHVLVKLKKTLDYRLSLNKDTFASALELAEYIRNYLETNRKAIKLPDPYILGDTEDFLNFLSMVDENHPNNVKVMLDGLRKKYDANLPIVNNLLSKSAQMSPFDKEHPFFLKIQNDKLAKALPENLTQIMATVLDLACRPLLLAIPPEDHKPAYYPVMYEVLRDFHNLYDVARPVQPKAAYTVDPDVIKSGKADKAILTLVDWFKKYENYPLVQCNLQLARIRAWTMYKDIDFSKPFKSAAIKSKI